MHHDTAARHGVGTQRCYQDIYIYICITKFLHGSKNKNYTLYSCASICVYVLYMYVVIYLSYLFVYHNYKLHITGTRHRDTGGTRLRDTGGTRHRDTGGTRRRNTALQTGYIHIWCLCACICNLANLHEIKKRLSAIYLCSCLA